jgi:hypothetical protein
VWWTALYHEPVVPGLLQAVLGIGSEVSRWTCGLGPDHEDQYVSVGWSAVLVWLDGGRGLLLDREKTGSGGPA